MKRKKEQKQLSSESIKENLGKPLDEWIIKEPAPRKKKHVKGVLYN